jgi:transposase
MKHMNSQSTAKLTHKNETTTETLGTRWRSAEQIAKTYGRSRPWVYAVADRFKLRSVSLAESGKTGARLFDAVQLEELLETLAEAQKDQPRINPRAKVKVEA